MAGAIRSGAGGGTTAYTFAAFKQRVDDAVDRITAIELTVSEIRRLQRAGSIPKDWADDWAARIAAMDPATAPSDPAGLSVRGAVKAVVSAAGTVFNVASDVVTAVAGRFRRP